MHVSSFVGFDQIPLIIDWDSKDQIIKTVYVYHSMFLDNIQFYTVRVLHWRALRM